jgi:hypothetical protein
LAAYKQFCLYKLVWDEDTKSNKKFPISPHTCLSYPKGADWQKESSSTTDVGSAIAMAALCGPEYGVGFLFTANDPFFFVDLDKCLNADNITWSSVAMDILARLPSAAVEVSQSGRGLHIFSQYSGAPPKHSCKNIPLGLELYTEGRFVALTGDNTIGSAGYDHSAHLRNVIDTYFAPKSATKDQEWTTEPVESWTGTDDDDELIERALKTGGGGAIFGDKATFKHLWECDEDALGKAYPDIEGQRAYDGSSADAALAQHLAFWTGNNCERIQKLMEMSAMVRDKWDREDYLMRTITRAVSLQDVVYSVQQVDDAIAQQFGAVKLRANSDPQRDYAVNVRAQKLQECLGEVELIEMFCKVPTAKFWLDNKDKTTEELRKTLTPIESAAAPLAESKTEIEILSGYQYLGATQQVEYFKGCVYIQQLHKVFTPNGALLKTEQFNATYGGYTFQLDDGGDKVTRKAWEAFTESQIVRYPKAEAMAFRPLEAPGALVKEEGRLLLNAYLPVKTKQLDGDVTPFLAHLAKVIPDKRDQTILLAYMAACIQHKGVKFQWAPLIQGVEGNGKTLFTRCVAFAIGDKYTHLPLASEMAEKFNEWLFNKLFIGIEDVYVPDHKKEIIEVLKPMITNDRLAMRAMQAGQVMGDNFANFILNSNYKDGIRKTRNDRRFCVFYSAQQIDTDIIRDGMDGSYFPDIYNWLKGDGYAIVANYLADYAIPAELNPAGACHRAPQTSSTDEAIFASLGGVEQEILEAIEEGRPGFAGGWVSSVAVERLLYAIHATRTIPHNRRKDLLGSLGYVWHPALIDGRVNNPIPMDDNKKPRLFVRKGHINCNIQGAAEVARLYQEAQGAQIVPAGNAAEVFKVK